MPLSPSGEKVLGSMKSQYGASKGKQVFYAAVNKGKPGSAKWHAPRPMRGGKR